MLPLLVADVSVGVGVAQPPRRTIVRRRMDFMKPPLFQPGNLLKAISMDGSLTLRARVKDVEG
jgi:hypothetical protein